MEETSTFTDCTDNQTNHTISSQSLAKNRVFVLAKEVFRKVKQLFIQEEITESAVESVFIEQTINTEDVQQPNRVVESVIPTVRVKQKTQFSHINYQLNIQQMNLFTYLRRAITSSEESLSGQFLEKFKNFLSVIVGTAPDNNAPLGFVKRDFGVLSHLGGSQLLSNKFFSRQGVRIWLGMLFLTLFTAFGTLTNTASAQQAVSLTNSPDLSVKKTIDNQSPAIGADVTYTVVVNNAGSAAATGVELTDVLPTGVTLKSISIGGVGSTMTSTTAGVTSIKWNIGSVSVSANLTMTVVATVTSRGLGFNVAQITKENEPDYDSTPNNNDINEDDQDAVCLSVADYFYKGDEFKIGLPAGYTNINWTIKVGNGVATPVTASTPGVKLNANKDTLTVSSISAYTEFAFSATNKNCPATGCCPAKFIPGPLGSIGDYVFNDLNKDGIQNAGDTPVAGVKVCLYNSNGVVIDSTITDASGKYLFDSLLTDNYRVRFKIPLGTSFTTAKVGVDGTDSDAGTDGFTAIIPIDVEKTGKAKDNLDVDAGIIGNLGSIGDFVWRDDNSNGIQDIGEPGISNVTVNLYKGTTLVATTTTDVNGKYLFGSLTSGAYQVEFVAPPQSKFTKRNQGDDTKDSDVGTNGRSQIINIDVTKLPTDTLRNNPQIDAGIIPLGSIGDYVFNDNNGNGIQDAGDTPVAGVKVYLCDKDGVRIDSTVTDANGKYNFIVPSGDYYVKFTKQPGQSFTQTGAGTSATDSDADPTTGKSGKVTIDTSKPIGDIGRNNPTIDAGIKPICNVSAGTLATNNSSYCLPAGTNVVLTATTVTPPVVPTGYSVKYILTQGANLLIQQISNTPTFNVSTVGDYTIHTIVFDGNSASTNFLDLSTVVLGTTKASDVLNIITTRKLCAALDVTGVKFNVLPIPVAPQVPGATICAGSSATLGTVNISDPIYHWYTSATAVNPFATTSSISVNPSVTTTYYVSTIANTPNACESLRTPVTVTVNQKPDAPVVKSGIANDCSKNLLTVNLADAIITAPTGATIEWHVANDITSALVTNPAAVGAGTYYAFSKSIAGGCYCSGVSVTVTITPCTCPNPATVTVNQIAAICGSSLSPVQLGAVLGGGATSGTWISTGTGTFDNANSLTAKYTPSASDLTKSSIEFTFTTNDPDGAGTLCNPASAKATLYIKAKPAAPYNLKCKAVICLGDTNKLFAVSLGNTVKWYLSTTSTTPIGTGSDEGFNVSPTSEGTFTYYAEATTPDGCISERSPISFTVKRCFTDLAVTKKVVEAPDAQSSPSYLLGQVITYEIDAQNIGSMNSSDVKVTDILPAGATYVSSSPSGRYDATTGTWNIGDLNAGSSKELLIQVRLSKTGSITNTAQISGTNEDPTKKANNTSSATINVIDIADLSLTKTVSKTNVNVGETIEYTITVLNSGPNTATNVEIKDKLPAGLSYVSSSTLTESAGTLTGTVASLAKGASASFTFKAKVNVVGKIINMAEVSKSDQRDPDSTPGNASTKPDEDDDDSVEINSTLVCNLEKPVIVCDKVHPPICLGESETLMATGCDNGTYVWSNGATGSSITISPKTTQSYTVYCMKGDCKSAPSDPVEVKVIIIDSPVLTASSTKICAGGTTTLTATGCGGVTEWQTSPKQTLPSITVSPTVSTTYKAICKEYGCVSAESSIDVIVGPAQTPPTIICAKSEICPGETVTLTAINCNGQVKWSTGETTSSITVSPSVTTSYTVTCTVNGCTSEPSKTFVLTVKPIDVPVIKASTLTVCSGSSSTLTVENCTGKITWYYNGKTEIGATIIVKPTATTSYSATCSSLICTSDKSSPVTIQVENPAPPIVSSGTSTICAGASVELTATGCAGGVITWSDGQKGAVVTVKPLVSTSYTATCTMGTCVSDASIKRTITVTEFGKPTITADKLSVCAGQSVTLTANGCNGTVKWSDGVTGSPRTVTPTADVKYTATCESSTCKSDVSNELAIKVNTIGTAPVISCTKTEICEGESVTLTATGCTGGTVKWSDNSTGTSITVKPSSTITYSAICVSGTCESPKSNEKTITVKPAGTLSLTATASSDKVCSGTETTLTLAGCTGGTVTWTGGLTGSSIKVKPTATTTYTATCTGVACSKDGSASVTVTVLPGATTPTITASSTQICAGAEATLTANNCNGTLSWSNGATTSSITVKPSATTTYTVQCKVDGCGDSKTSDPTTIKVSSPDVPAITSSKDAICAAESVTLTATGCTGGTVKWSDGSTGTSITVKPSGTTTYTAVCVMNGCESAKSNAKTITVNPVGTLSLTATASSDKVCSGTETTLTLAGCTGGTVTWTGGLTGSSIKVKPTATTTYTATCTGVACSKDGSASVTVTVLPGATTPTITASSTQICAGAEATLTANNCNGTLSWSNGATTSSITVKPSATTTYTVQCKIEACNDSKTSDGVTVKVGNPDAPTVATSLSSVCAGGSVVLTATGCTTGTVVWSNGKTGTSITETVNATTTYSAVCKQGTCNSSESNKVIVKVTVPSVPTISCATSTICAGTSLTLVASGCEGTVKWSDGQTGTIVTVAPTKTTDYTATCTVGTCTSVPSSVATVNVGLPPAPHITCNATSICQGIQITLTATNCEGTVVWNDGQVGNVVTAKPNSTTKYNAICKLDKCESGISNEVTVTVGAGISTPKTKNLTNVCPFVTVDLASGVTSGLSAGGVFEYHTGVLPSSPLVSNPNAAGTGAYYVFEKTASGCYSTPGVIYTYINTDCTPKDCAKTPATTSAGADATICSEKIYTLSGKFGGAATNVTWRTTGTGTFDNPLLPNATYRSSLADVLAGTVKLIITTNDPDGTGVCTAATDTMVLTMQGVKFKPTIVVKGNLNTCGSDTVTLTATAGAYTYKWYKVGTTTEIATTRSITVNKTGAYFFKLIDANKCCSIESDTANVNVLDVITAPVANNVKIDKGTTVDLNKLVVSNTPTGATLIFKIGASTGSTTVANPSAVGAGTYYACYKSAQGCFSSTSKILVENKPDVISTDADIDIVVTTENNVAVDSTVKVTIKVTNKGPAVAKGVKVSAPIPTGLTFVSQTGGLVRTGNLLGGSIDSLISGGVKIYTWIGKVVKGTSSVTVSATGTSNNSDPNLNNNNSSNPNGSSTVTFGSIGKQLDLALALTADKQVTTLNDEVTFTLTVKNNGPLVATNVVVDNILPKQLTYVSGDPTKKGDTLRVSIASIAVGKSQAFTYKAKVSKDTTITNIAKITKVSPVDSVIANNTATVVLSSASDCKLGLALAVIDTAKVSQGVYNVTYRLIAKNFCKDTLKNVTLVSNSLANTFKSPVVAVVVGKPSTGTNTHLIVNDAFSLTDSSLVKTGSYMIPGAVDTVKYVVKVTLNGNKGPFYSQATVTGKKPDNAVLTAKSSDGSNVNGTPSKTVLRFDLPNTRIGLAKEVIVTALKNDSTTYWTVPYRIRVVNMGANNVTNNLSVKDSLDAVFTAKGAVLVGKPIIIGTPGLTINKKYTGKGEFTDLLVPDSSSIAKGDTAIIDLTVRVNTAGTTDVDKIFNNVAIGVAVGSDNVTYKDISTNGNNPDANGDKDPSNDNVATPVQLKSIQANEVSIGLALAAQTDTIPLADSTYNVTLIMTAKNYGKVNLSKVRLCTNIDGTIGKQAEAWKLVGTPRVVRGNAKISSTFNGKADSTLTKTDSTFLAVGDSIVVAYIVNVKHPINDTISTQAFAKAISALDSTKSTSDISVNGVNPDLNGDGKPSEAAPTPIIFKNAIVLSELFIPQGFSPNGDGINDKFVIQGVNKATEKVELIIFNRWGGVVYASQDYQNDWVGQANSGVKVVGDGQGLPDGTYFYCVTRSNRLSGEKIDTTPKVRYFTISR